jgi:LysM repeat protein
MPRRSPARWLAPLALVTAAVAVYAVVHNETSSSKDGTTPSSTSTTGTGARTATTKKGSKKKQRTYTVKAGDVLSVIAAKNGTTVQELERLNPQADASALHPGQKLKLPR